MWLLADSEHTYVLKCYIYEGAKYDKSSGIAGAEYDVVCPWMEMGKFFDNCHHLITDNLFTTYAAANYLSERGTFMTGTMRQNHQLQHMPNEIVTAKPKVGEKSLLPEREIPCHLISAKAISEQACYYAVNFLFGI